MRRLASSAAATMRAREAASAACASAFAIAVPTSSVKPASRASMSGGRTAMRAYATVTTPHRQSSTLIGTPTAEPNPQPRPALAKAPDELR